MGAKSCLNGVVVRAGRFRAAKRGSVLVETTLALMLAVPVVFGVFEVCMFTYTESVLGDAARVGVRYAIVHGADSAECSGPSSGCADPGAANVAAVVQEDAANSLHDLSAMTVNVSYPDDSSAPPSLVVVTINYTYIPYIALPGMAQAMGSTAEGRIVY